MSEQEIYILQSLEADGVVEIAGAFTDLEKAKHFLEGKYPYLSEWTPCPKHSDCGLLSSHTGKHPVIIERTVLYP